jgi:ribosome-associated toxin RatA of RatAB toxin-antitoxin module
MESKMATSHHLENSIVIKSKLEDVYALAEDVESYPEFIPGYEGSKVLSREENKATIERVAEIMGNQITWKSVATFHQNESIEFEQIEGPLRGMIAKWTFQQAPEGTKIVITHDFKLKTPIPGWQTESIIEGVSGTADTALKSLKKKVEA